MITSSSRVLYGFTVGPCHEMCARLKQWTRPSEGHETMSVATAMTGNRDEAMSDDR